MNFTLCVEITNFIRPFCAKFLVLSLPFFFLFSFLFPITFPSVSIHFPNINPSVKSNLYKVFQFRGLFPFFLLHHVSRFGHAKSIGHCYDSWLEIREPFYACRLTRGLVWLLNDVMVEVKRRLNQPASRTSHISAWSNEIIRLLQGVHLVDRVKQFPYIAVF